MFWQDAGEIPDVPNAPTPGTLADYAYNKVKVPETEVQLKPAARSTVNLPTSVWLDKGAFEEVKVRAELPGKGLWAETTAKPIALHLEPGTKDAETFPASGDCEINEDGSIGTPYTKGDAPTSFAIATSHSSPPPHNPPLLLKGPLPALDSFVLCRTHRTTIESRGRRPVARRALKTTAATLTAMAALLLTACGGSDDKPSDDIKGADSGSSPSTSTSASTPSGPERPDITIPSSFRLTFENWTSSDPDEQAVLNDGKEQLRAGYAAIIENKPDGGDALAFYDTEAGLSQDREWIKSYTGKNVTVIGELPVFDPQATLFAKKTKAQLRYCTDESKAQTKNRKTGEVVGNPAGTDPQVAYVVTMQKNEQGVWQTVSTNSKRGGCS
jgi:hypothetical protein